MTRPRLISSVVVALSALAGFASASSGVEKVVGVLVGGESPPYLKAVEGLRDELARQVEGATPTVVFLTGDHAKTSTQVETLVASADLVVSLGGLATNTAEQLVGTTPLVAGMVLNAEGIPRGENRTGVALEFSLEEQLDWLRRLLPRTSRIAVLFSTDYNRRLVDAARPLAEDRGLRLVDIEIAGPRQIPAALRRVEIEAQVLWGLSDPMVFSPAMAKRLLLFSFENRLPLVGLSASWVGAGALYSLERDYHDIGTQLGEITARILAGGTASAIPPQRPRRTRLLVNERTARQMRLTIDEDVLSVAETFE